MDCVCGNTSYRTLMAGEWNRGLNGPIAFEVARCEACGLARTLPVPDVSRYRNAEARSSDNPLEDTWAGFFTMPGPGRLLDIGCSTGNLVA